MPRLRTLKPTFFTNDELAAVPPLGRLLFAGLWCIADRCGRLEDKPPRIKVEVLPYDRCNVDALLTELHDRGFILRYQADGQRYIQVVNFEKHQRPHMKELESIIPAPTQDGASTDPGPVRPGGIRSSGYLSLGSGIPSLGAREKSRTTTLDEGFISQLIAEYGDRLGGEQAVRDSLSLCIDNARRHRYRDLQAAARNWFAGDRKVRDARARTPRDGVDFSEFDAFENSGFGGSG